jgi:spoIIIJ-associated protein
MSEIQIIAQTREQALREALDRLGLPEEALDIQWGQEQEDLLPGAKPLVQLNVEVRPQYVADKVKDCLDQLLNKMAIPHDLTSEVREGIILVSARCDQPDVLIGHRGETLDALQHLVVRIAGVNGREIPLVLVDVGNYRLRRIQRLKRVCQDLSQAVLKSGVEEHFDPMEPIDRKIVHTLLKKIKGIRTFSRGEDASRHVIVAPEV